MTTLALIGVPVGDVGVAPHDAVTITTTNTVAHLQGIDIPWFTRVAPRRSIRYNPPPANNTVI